MKYIYVCSPYGGEEENYKRALVYGKFVVGTGNIPIIPHTMLHGVLDDKITAEREKGLAAGLKLLMDCDELWVFGGVVTAGMKNEISVAESKGIEVVHQSSVISPDELSADVAIIYSYYEKMYNRCNRAMVDDAFYFLKEGLSCDLILWTIEEAVRREKPWIYSKAILERCKAQNITTRAQAEQAKAGKIKKQNSSYAGYDLEKWQSDWEKQLAAEDDKV